MIDTPDKFERLKAIYDNAILLKEGGRAVVLLPLFSFSFSSQTTETMDLLLVPYHHSGYDTRLFFERVIEGKAKNWTCHRVVDRNWHAPSWNGVSASLPWPEMLCAHLRAIQ